MPSRAFGRTRVARGVAGVLAIVSVSLVSYFPILKMGFRFVDDYTYLFWAGTQPLIQYLTNVLDPRRQNINYRPLRRILVLLEYYAFRGDATPYHLVQILFHAANAMLVLAIVLQVTKRWRSATLAGLFFAGLPVASEAVFWISDEAVLATFFSLIAVWSWVRFLQNDWRGRSFNIALGATVLALLCKESAIVLPVIFLVIDRLIVRRRGRPAEWVRTYVLISIVTAAYLLIELAIQSQGTFGKEGGYGWGTHVFSNYAAYLGMLAFPWANLPAPAGAVPVLIGIGFAVLVILLRKPVLIALALSAMIGIGPVVLASLGPGARYLYPSTIPLAILWAAGFDFVWARTRRSRLAPVMPVLFIGLLGLNAVTTADAAYALGETARQTRVPFRDILREHSSLASSTRFFLIEPPFNVTASDIRGLFFLQYGDRASVGATFRDGQLYTGGRLRAERANLRASGTAYVYYFDEMHRPVEVPVEWDALTQVSAPLPQRYRAPIRLEGYEVTATHLERGKEWVLILYWRAEGKSDKDYTVFVHLVNSRGETVAGVDERPRRGNEETSRWEAGRFTADAHVLEIPEDLAPGTGYRVEVGLYDLATLERVPLMDGEGRVTGDSLSITSFEVLP